MLLSTQRSDGDPKTTVGSARQPRKINHSAAVDNEFAVWRRRTKSWLRSLTTGKTSESAWEAVGAV